MSFFQGQASRVQEGFIIYGKRVYRLLVRKGAAVTQNIPALVNDTADSPTKGSSANVTINYSLAGSH